MFGGRAWERARSTRRHAGPVVPAPVRTGATGLELGEPGGRCGVRRRSCGSGSTGAMDGFRIDVAHSMIKAPGLPDLELDESGEPIRSRPDRHPVPEPGRRPRHLPRAGEDRRFVPTAAGPAGLRLRGLGRRRPTTGPIRTARRGSHHVQFRLADVQWTAASQRGDRSRRWGLRVRSAHPRPGCCPTTTCPGGDSLRAPETGARFTQDGIDSGGWQGICCRRRDGPISISVAAGLVPPSCWSWRCPVARTSTRATSSACRRSRTCPRSRCGIPTWERSGHTDAAATAAACRSRGPGIGRRSASVRPRPRPGCRSRRIGPG